MEKRRMKEDVCRIAWEIERGIGKFEYAALSTIPLSWLRSVATYRNGWGEGEEEECRGREQGGMALNAAPSDVGSCATFILRTLVKRGGWCRSGHTVKVWRGPYSNAPRWLMFKVLVSLSLSLPLLFSFSSWGMKQWKPPYSGRSRGRENGEGVETGFGGRRRGSYIFMPRSTLLHFSTREQHPRHFRISPRVST